MLKAKGTQVTKTQIGHATEQKKALGGLKVML